MGASRDGQPCAQRMALAASCVLTYAHTSARTTHPQQGGVHGQQNCVHHVCIASAGGHVRGGDVGGGAQGAHSDGGPGATDGQGPVVGAVGQRGPGQGQSGTGERVPPSAGPPSTVDLASRWLQYACALPTCCIVRVCPADLRKGVDGGVGLGHVCGVDGSWQHVVQQQGLQVGLGQAQ